MIEHGILFYLQPLAIGLSVSVFLCVLLIAINRYLPTYKFRNDQRHIHKKNISRWGGVAIITGSIIALIVNNALVMDRIIFAIIFGGIIIAIFGIGDDLRPLSWKVQIFFQVTLALSVFVIGIHLTYIALPLAGSMLLVVNGISIISVIFSVFWMLLILNAVNWSDGLDGLSGGVVLISSIAFFFISLQPQVLQPPLAIMISAFAGSVLGFLIFNFPKARIMAGTSGAFFMGYFIALIAIAAGAKIGTAVLVLIVPLSDLMWVIMQRLKNGQVIFHADTSHLHHKLLQQGWSVKKILVFYYTVTIICAIIAVTTQSLNKLLLFAIAVACISFFIVSLDHVSKKV